MKSLSFLKLYLILFFLIHSGLLGCAGDSKGFSLAHKNTQAKLTECKKLSKKKKYEDAIKCYEAYKSQIGMTGTATADLAIADAYFQNKDYLVAAEAYNLFVQSYPRHTRTAYSLMQSGLSYLRQAPRGHDRDFGSLDDALSQFQTVINHYPESPHANEARLHREKAQLKIAKKHFYIARFYYRYNEYLAAIPRFEIIARDFPRVGLEEDAYYLLIKSLKKSGQTDVARRYFEVFKQFYPEKKKTVKKIARLF